MKTYRDGIKEGLKLALRIIKCTTDKKKMKVIIESHLEFLDENFPETDRS